MPYSVTQYPFQPKQFVGPLILILMAVVIHFLPEAMQSSLVYQRQQVESHQWWRLISANLTHTNGFHVLLNCLGVILMWLLHGYAYRALPYLLFFLVNGLCVTLGLYFFTTEMLWYAGLSGVLHGLFVWGCYQDIKAKMSSGYWLLAACIAKVIHEQWSGAQLWLENLIAANVAVDAHLYGMLGGLVWIVCLGIRDWHNRASTEA